MENIKKVDIKVSGQHVKTDPLTYMDGAPSFLLFKVAVSSSRATSRTEHRMVDAVKSQTAAGTKAKCRMV